MRAAQDADRSLVRLVHRPGAFEIAAGRRGVLRERRKVGPSHAAGLGELGIAGPEESLTGGESLLVQSLGFRMERQLDVDRAEQRLHLGAQEGLVGQLLVHPRRATIEEVASRELLPLGAIGIREQEHVLKEALRGLRAMRLSTRHRRLPDRDSEPGENGEQRHERRQDAAAVPHDEFPQAVGRGVGTRQHGQSPQVALDVVAQRCGGRVAPSGLPMKCLEQDGVDVAFQASRRHPIARVSLGAGATAQRGAGALDGLVGHLRRKFRPAGVGAVVRQARRSGARRAPRRASRRRSRSSPARRGSARAPRRRGSGRAAPSAVRRVASSSLAARAAWRCRSRAASPRRRGHQDVRRLEVAMHDEAGGARSRPRRRPRRQRGCASIDAARSRGAYVVIGTPSTCSSTK